MIYNNSTQLRAACSETPSQCPPPRCKLPIPHRIFGMKTRLEDAARPGAQCAKRILSTERKLVCLVMMIPWCAHPSFEAEGKLQAPGTEDNKAESKEGSIPRLALILDEERWTSVDGCPTFPPEHPSRLLPSHVSRLGDISYLTSVSCGTCCWSWKVCGCIGDQFYYSLESPFETFFTP